MPQQPQPYYSPQGQQPQHPLASYPPPGPQNWTPPGPVTPPPPQKRGNPVQKVLLGVLGALALVVVATLVAAAVSGEDPQTTTPTAANVAEKAKAPAGTPTADDFALTAKVTDRTCTSAGCRVVWIPEIAYTGPKITGDDTWIVSYAVAGIESGTAVGKIVMGSTGPAKQREKRARVEAEGSKITLKVVSVERG